MLLLSNSQSSALYREAASVLNFADILTSYMKALVGRYTRVSTYLFLSSGTLLRKLIEKPRCI